MKHKNKKDTHTPLLLKPLQRWQWLWLLLGWVWGFQSSLALGTLVQSSCLGSAGSPKVVNPPLAPLIQAFQHEPPPVLLSSTEQGDRFETYKRMDHRRQMYSYIQMVCSQMSGLLIMLFSIESGLVLMTGCFRLIFWWNPHKTFTASPVLVKFKVKSKETKITTCAYFFLL